MPKRLIKTSAPSKINLALDVLEKTDSGYHKVRTILHETPQLSDRLQIEEIQEDDNLSIINADPEIEYTPEKSLAFRALKLLKAELKCEKNVRITIQKNIPLKSGLGGESSCAAAVLKGLSELWNLKLSKKQLHTLASKLSMDTVFFLDGGTALAEGFGEIITPLKHLPLNIELQPLTSSLSNKTAQMYDQLDLNVCARNRAKTEALLTAIKTEDLSAIRTNIHNDFETLSPTPKNWHLSGSGPSLFRLL